MQERAGRHASRHLCMERMDTQVGPIRVEVLESLQRYGTLSPRGRLTCMSHFGLGSVLTAVGVATARPIAIFVIPAYAAGWALFEAETFDWHAVAVLAAWAMTFLIQRAAHRDTQAIHAKLDELLREHPAARSELEHLDDEEPEAIERHRQREQG